MLAQAWFFVVAGHLIVSGVAKIMDPAPTTGALSAARLPSGRWAVYGLSTIEVAAAAWALAFGGIAVLAVAALYGAFGGFVIAALRFDLPLTSCGCFGTVDTPPTWMHVAYNGLGAAAAVVVALDGFGGVWSVEGGDVFARLVTLGFVGLGVFASYLLLSELPRLLAEVKST